MYAVSLACSNLFNKCFTLQRTLYVMDVVQKDLVAAEVVHSRRRIESSVATESSGFGCGSTLAAVSVDSPAVRVA